MNDLDRKIQEALRGADGGDRLAREPNIAGELIGIFRGRHRWLHGMAFAFSIAFTVVAFWAGYRFCGADAMSDQLRWGGLCLLALLFVSFIKVYFWLEMDTNRVLRELKRIELLLLQRQR